MKELLDFVEAQQRSDQSIAVLVAVRPFLRHLPLAGGPQLFMRG
ncbi:MAG: hypothetical protein WBE09_07740 [Candidatus Acidiferrales bacterium]